MTTEEAKLLLQKVSKAVDEIDERDPTWYLCRHRRTTFIQNLVLQTYEHTIDEPDISVKRMMKKYGYEK